MNPAKHTYETTFIVNASLEDAQIESLIAHVQEIITSNGGENVVVNRWGRKRLAYTIQKKNNGYYANIEFNGLGSIVSRLEHMFTLDENVLRFLTIQLNKKALLAQQQNRSAAVPEESVPTDTAVQTREPLFADETPTSEKNV